MSSEAPQSTPLPGRVNIRWWPAGVILGLMVLAMGGVQSWSEFPFQRRNLICLGIAGGAAGLELLWWLFLSRARWTLRLAGLAGIALLAGTARLTLRIRGVTGDLIPIVETRWAQPSTTLATAGTITTTDATSAPVTPPVPTSVCPGITPILGIKPQRYR